MNSSNNNLTICFILFVLMLLFQACSSNDRDPVIEQDQKVLYVSPLGSDTNSGENIETPLKTVQKAIDLAEPGCNVMLLSGTYTEKVEIQNAGTDNAPIILSAYETHKPILDGESLNLNGESWNGLIRIKGIKNIVIKGITIKNSNVCGIFVGETSSNITIENCTISNCIAPAISVGNDNHVGSENITVRNNVVDNCSQDYQEAISLRGVNKFEISNNRVSNIIREGIDAKSGCTNGIIYGNVVTNARAVGIYIDGGYANTRPQHTIDVYQNTVRNCKIGIVIASEAGNKCSDINIFNNIVYDDSKRPVEESGAGIKVAIDNSGIEKDGNLENIYIINNTVYNRQQQGIYVNTPLVKNIVIRNNISIKNSNQIALGTDVNASNVLIENNLFYGVCSNKGLNFVEADPLFENLTGFNFNLTQKSPAIDKGTSTKAPQIDFDGNKRPQGKRIDIGAFEYLN